MTGEYEDQLVLASIMAVERQINRLVTALRNAVDGAPYWRRDASALLAEFEYTKPAHGFPIGERTV